MTGIGVDVAWRTPGKTIAVTPATRAEAAAPDTAADEATTALVFDHLSSDSLGLAQRATLEVRRSNDPARLLYERFGFAVAGVRRAYYTKPVEDALVLWHEGLTKS